ncbi:MAG: SDR family oxidoreductase [Betaproteobacteria bacterium]|nr:SDR family oxidoreductase [Betaproteobacteria bacterium]
MDIKGKIAVITGAASGIGRAAALRFAREGAAGIVVADLNAEGLSPVATETGGLAVTCDVSKEEDIKRLVAEAEAKCGRIDVFFSNAGIISRGGLETSDEAWEQHWKIHVMAHVWAARAVVEKMIEREGGYFLVTASAAGLLNIVESAPYGVTKHGAVAFAEWLAIAYGRRGLCVSCLCPQAVLTGMYKGTGSAGVDGALTAEQVADEIVKVMARETFLILPHPQVLEYLRAKAGNYDRWIGGMQKIFLRQQQP